MRVMIAEDSGLFREMLADLLTGRGFRVTGQAATKPALLSLVDSEPPDVVLLDIRLPPGQRDEGLQAAREIRARHQGIGLLVLSHYAETSYAVRLLRETASRGVGYLVKDRVSDSDRLVEAIEQVAAGAVVVDPEVVERVMQRRHTADRLVGLSPAEYRTLRLLAEGHSNAAIARRLRCSAKTVERYVTTVFRKLGLPDVGDEGRAEVNVRVLAVLTYLRASTPDLPP